MSASPKTASSLRHPPEVFEPFLRYFPVVMVEDILPMYGELLLAVAQRS
jgi:hypothetical protein